MATGRPVPNAEPAGRPYVGAGSLASLQRCRFRFASQLRGEIRRTPTDPSMRLWSALSDALRAAHDRAIGEQTGVGDVLDPTPPTSLSTEEGIVFRRAIAHYGDAFGDDETWPLHPAAGAPSSRAVATTTPFEIGTKVELLFAAPNGPLLRRVHLRGAPPHGEATPPIADLATAVALRLPAGRARNDVVLRVDHLWTSGLARVQRVDVLQDHLDAFRGELHGSVTDALDDPTPTPGWWCTGCPLVKECPSVPSEPATRLLEPGAPLQRRRTAIPALATAHDPTLGDPVQPAPGLLVLSATRLRDFDDCPRRFFLAHVVRVPVDTDEHRGPDGDDELAGHGEAANLGLLAHTELCERHRQPDRHDDEGLVSDEVPNDAWLLGRVDAHRALCPRDRATYLGGELDLRWLDRRKALLVTGRVDALWRHDDGTIDVRDYKTGRSTGTLTDLRDDPAAAIYALLAASQPGAGATTKVRVTYELLGEATPREVHLDATPASLAAAVELVESTADRIRRERNFMATPSPSVCGRCPYRGMCAHRRSAEPEPDPSDPRHAHDSLDRFAGDDRFERYVDDPAHEDPWFG